MNEMTNNIMKTGGVRKEQDTKCARRLVKQNQTDTVNRYVLADLLGRR